MSRYLIVLLAAFIATATCRAADTPATSGSWIAGTNYFLIDPPQPTASGDKVEVLEIFSYACPHCAHFQPYAHQLAESLPKYAAFGYMPAIFHPDWEPFARAFYTAQSLGILDKTHQALYDALHRDHLPLRTIEDIAAYFGKMGFVDAAKFLAASSSFEVESKLARSRDMVRNYGVDGTPSIVVNGKYRVTAASAGGNEQLIRLVDWLVKKEHTGAGKPAAK